MRRMIDNFQPIQIGTALILLILSFVLNTDGVIFPIYMVAVIGSLLFFSPFESYMIVGPILTIISTMVVFGLQIVKEGWLFNPHFYVDNFYFNHRRNDIFHSSPCYDSKTRKIFRNC